MVEPSATGSTAWLAALFAFVSCLAAIDLVSDIREGASVSHWGVEAGLLALSLLGVAVMIRALIRQRRRAARLEVETRSLSDRLRAQAVESVMLRDQLLAVAADAEQWREDARELLAGLSRAIDRQFEKWSLTVAEREVALLLLKGLSHKEIAGVRDTGEATARQQARAVYAKAGLAGRNELSAFFLEDLLAPMHRRTEGCSPDGAEPMTDLMIYKRMPEWTAATLPPGFRRKHNTKEGTWAELTVHAGALRFTDLDAEGNELGSRVIDADAGPQLIAPGAWHKVEPVDDTLRCSLAFLCESSRYMEKKHGVGAAHSASRALPTEDDERIPAEVATRAERKPS